MWLGNRAKKVQGADKLSPPCKKLFSVSVYQDLGAITKSPSPLPSPKGRGETRYSLALWERAGVRGLNLDILSISRFVGAYLCGRPGG